MGLKKYVQLPGSRHDIAEAIENVASFIALIADPDEGFEPLDDQVGAEFISAIQMINQCLEYIHRKLIGPFSEESRTLFDLADKAYCHLSLNLSLPLTGEGHKYDTQTIKEFEDGINVIEQCFLYYNLIQEEFMIINHLIIGSNNIVDSEFFYVNFLGFKKISTFVDTGTGATGFILRHQNKNKVYFDIMLVPMKLERLPSPQHIAFEVNFEEFDIIQGRLQSSGIDVRARPELTSTEQGIGTLDQNGIVYDIMYFCDPSHINIEIMRVRK